MIVHECIIANLGQAVRETNCLGLASNECSSAYICNPLRDYDVSNCHLIGDAYCVIRPAECYIRDLFKRLGENYLLYQIGSAKRRNSELRYGIWKNDGCKSRILECGLTDRLETVRQINVCNTINLLGCIIDSSRKSIVSNLPDRRWKLDGFRNVYLAGFNKSKCSNLTFLCQHIISSISDSRYIDTAITAFRNHEGIVLLELGFSGFG